jgi:hypothetical protein
MYHNATKYTQPTYRSFAKYILIVIITLGLGGCYSNVKHSNEYIHHGEYYDPHVTDYYEFYYYPEQHVYYDIHRHIYHYNHHNRGWIAVNRLPPHILLSHKYRKKLKYHHNLPWYGKHKDMHHANNHGEPKQHAGTHKEGQRKDKNRAERKKSKHDGHSIKNRNLRRDTIKERNQQNKHTKQSAEPRTKHEGRNLALHKAHYQTAATKLPQGVKQKKSEKHNNHAQTKHKTRQLIKVTEQQPDDKSKAKKKDRKKETSKRRVLRERRHSDHSKHMAK